MKLDNLIIRSPYLSDLPTAPTADSLVNRPVAGDSQPIPGSTPISDRPTDHQCNGQIY